MDKLKIDSFWAKRTEIEDSRIATNYRNDGRLEYDVDLVKRFLKSGDRILDLGAGTCTLAARLVDLAREVVAVEKHGDFLLKSPDQTKIVKVCEDVLDFESTERFDVILLFGVVNFLTADEERALYHNARQMLAPDGIFIVKHQCGMTEEVIVDGFSHELNGDYHARYPSVQHEHDMLSSLFSVRIIDPYPPSLHRWPNTRFYAFLCRHN